MNFVLEGFIAGIVLMFAMGPIFVYLSQTSIEKGKKSGFFASSGVWISDLIIIFLSLTFINKLRYVIESPSFNFWMGMAGGIVMILFGLGLILFKTEVNFNEVKIENKQNIGYFIKGFLLNTLNPFTYVYWLGIISSYVLGKKAPMSGTLLFLGTIMGVIIFSDSAKILLADLIRKKLTPKHISYASYISGVFLIGFGIFLMMNSTKV